MAARGLVSVEEVSDRKTLQRFRELPFALHGAEPQWPWPVRAYEQWRLDPHRNPFFDRGDAAYLLARRLGRPAGRITAHVRHEGDEGWFGFLATVDDGAVVGSLVDAARAWLVERGCTTMTGPLSFTAEDELGVLTHGFDAAGLTARPWHPPYYVERLRECGLEPVEARHTWRHATEPSSVAVEPDVASRDGLPPHAGPYADPRLVLPTIAAVPDVSPLLRSTGLRGAWRQARRARAREFDTCVVVRVDGDPAVAVPALRAVAGAAGYRSVVAPWTAGPSAPPETTHEVLRLEW